MESRDLTSADIERFVARTGKKAERILNILGKNEQFLNAISSPLGQELLTDSVERMELLLEKIIDEKADDKDRADFRALRAIATRWAERINVYQKALVEAKKP